MVHQRKARLAGGNAALRWLADPVVAVPDTALSGLYASVLAAPRVVVMAALTSAAISITAALRTGERAFWIFLLLDLTVLALRLQRFHRARRAIRAGRLPAIEPSMLLSLAWCALQGLMAFTIALTGDMPLLVVTLAFILGLTAPICARNYAMPRMATLMVMLCDLPFKLGLALSGEPLLWLLLPLTVPFFLGVRALLGNFGRMLGLSLETAEHNRRLAGRDSLTGLVNRHGLDETLARMTDTPERPVVLLCIDLDRFKPVNDLYGHAAGDSVLVEVAARLRKVTPHHGFIARLGGDEFMVAVGGLTPDDAGPFAQALHYALATPHYRLDDGAQAAVGASVGYACFPEDAATFDQLRRRADAALYASKRSGVLRRYDASLSQISDAA
ncbi:MAG: GGDEF domain-containing protein [Sphingomonas paucimobilis]